MHTDPLFFHQFTKSSLFSRQNSGENKLKPKCAMFLGKRPEARAVAGIELKFQPSGVGLWQPGIDQIFGFGLFGRF